MMADMVNGMEADDLLIHLFGYEDTHSRLTVLSVKSNDIELMFRESNEGRDGSWSYQCMKITMDLWKLITKRWCIPGTRLGKMEKKSSSRGAGRDLYTWVVSAKDDASRENLGE